MGRLLTIHPCPVCNYHVEDELHEGTSGMDTIFLRNHYALALCQDCHHVVSVLVPNTNQETQDALKAARSDLVQVEADAVIGDREARDILPLLRAALDRFGEDAPVAITECTMCGSKNIQVPSDVTGALFDAQDAWIQCPKCEEGRLLVETTGNWR